MGRVIAVGSQKGGVGKTTTVLNLGFSLSRLGSKVLLVDGDPQRGLAIATNLRKKARGGLVDVLRGRLDPEDALTVTRDGTMAILGIGDPQPEDVIFIESEAAGGGLGQLIRQLATGYDYAFVDAPGGVGTLPQALLAACDALIIALACKAIAVKSLPAMLKAYQYVGLRNRAMRLEGVVVTMFDAKNANQAALAQRLKEALPAPSLFRTVIPYDERFELACMKAIPVAMLAGGAEAARSYMDLAMELKQREAPGPEGASDDDAAGLF